MEISTGFICCEIANITTTMARSKRSRSKFNKNELSRQEQERMDAARRRDNKKKINVNARYANKRKHSRDTPIYMVCLGRNCNYL